jgi:ATP-dependent Lhr-like helicase
MMNQVAEFTDFPVLLESWRTCLDDEFDLPALTGMLDEVHDGLISWSSVSAATPSPLAGNLTFDTISRYMYADDTPTRSAPSSLSDELIANALAHEQLRPKIPPQVVDQFVQRRQRLLPGYEPGSDEEWQDWLKERVLLPEAEVSAAMLAAGPNCWVSEGERRWLVHPELLPVLSASGLVTVAQPVTPLPQLEDNRSALQLGLEMLSFYGPLTEAEIRVLLPRIPEGMFEEDALVSGALMASDTALRYCDRDNFEALLRMQRASARPQVEARPGSALAPFLAAWQGFNRPLNDDTLADVLSRLRGYSAPPGIWLHDLMHARFAHFSSHQLDAAVSELELVWFGCGREQVTLGYPEDMDLLTDPPQSPTITRLFTDPDARYSFFQLADKQSRGIEDFNDEFWQALWQGEIFGDTLAALRTGTLSSFKLTGKSARPQSAGNLRPSRRRSVGRIGSGWPGNWLLRPESDDETDPLTELEDNKERARMLLERYGMVCRELANREGGKLRWARLARALFAMELAGEIVAGYFFTGLSGPQFMTQAALQSFINQPGSGTFWLNALDPASPCALGLGATDDQAEQHEQLPARRPGNLLSYFEGRLALTIENSGRRLTFLVPPDDPALPEICAPLLYLAQRQRRFTVEEINGEDTATSPYLAPLSRLLTAVRDHKHMTFEASR